MKINKQNIYKKALTARLVEESLLELFSQGKLHGTVHTCIGQEMSGAVVTEFLGPGDNIFSNHRCHGHYLSFTDDVEGLIAEVMGKDSGVCGGIGGSQHLYKNGFFSNGIQGGIVPVAAGLALGHKLRNDKKICVVFIGDGTLGEGVVYETLNIASKWSIPLLIVLEDNKYAQSTKQSETLSGEILDRPKAFNIKSKKLNTWEWEKFHDEIGHTIKEIREDSRPQFIHLETYRLQAHSKGDDTRPKSEVDPWLKKDPINLLLKEQTKNIQADLKAIKKRIARAIEVADKNDKSSLYVDRGKSSDILWQKPKKVDKKRLVEHLNITFKNLMKNDPDIYMLGEDILSPYGGAFKATKDISELYPNAIKNTPISEASIVGIAIGLGFLEFKPVVEIMFGDFITLAFDQIVNHAAKFYEMYNKQIQTNLIVRTPMGGGRGYGPTHSQTLDRHFFGVPGLRIVALNSLVAPEIIYKPLFDKSKANKPTLVIENKTLYGSYLGRDLPEGFILLHSEQEFPVVLIKPESNDVDITLLGYGAVADLFADVIDELFNIYDVVAQCLIITEIFPFKIDPLIPLISNAPNLLIVEEGQGFSGFGSEVIAQIVEQGQFNNIKAKRLFAEPHCIPASKELEQDMIPNTNRIIEETLRMIEGS